MLGIDFIPTDHNTEVVDTPTTTSFEYEVGNVTILSPFYIPTSQMSDEDTLLPLSIIRAGQPSLEDEDVAFLDSCRSRLADQLEQDEF